MLPAGQFPWSTAWWPQAPGECLLTCAIIAIGGAARPGLRADVEEMIEKFKGKGRLMTVQEIQQEIERTREHLGETVDELAAKADMKARARAKAAEAKARAQDMAAQVSGRMAASDALRRRWPAAVAAGVVIVGSVALWRWNKKR
jgi:hypothetical protein